MNGLSFVWLEITGRCQLECEHCYAESGPRGTSGAMAVDDWLRVIDQAAELGAKMVQFIGGEPTLHPALPDLVARALDRRLEVEVFSNLVHVTPRLWKVFEQRGVRLATSYYADTSEQHEGITKRRGSYTRTKANLTEAVRRSIPLRVGLIDVGDGQRVTQAHEELMGLGVTDIRMDRLRQVGRGVRDQQPDISQLCGACAHGKVAVTTSGDVWPCVFARWMPVGNVRATSLSSIAASDSLLAAREVIGESSRMGKCDPKSTVVPRSCAVEVK